MANQLIMLSVTPFTCQHANVNVIFFLFYSLVCDSGYGRTEDDRCEVCPVGKYYKSGQRFSFVSFFREGSCVACRTGYTTASPGALNSEECGTFPIQKPISSFTDLFCVNVLT